MAKTRKYFLATILTLIISALVTSSLFAATSVTSWHSTLAKSTGNNNLVGVGSSFKVLKGTDVTIKVDQYVKGSNGAWDKSKTANVTYYLVNVDTGKKDEYTLTANGNFGGATNKPAASKTFKVKTAGEYMVSAKNNITYDVATGGNVYLSK